MAARMDTTPTTLLREARLWVGTNLESPGVICPACDQVAALRPRTLHRSMCIALLTIRRYLLEHPTEPWAHLERVLKSANVDSRIRGDAVKLVYWGLLEKATNDATSDDDSDDDDEWSFARSKGYYRLTAVGELFSQNRTSVPRRGWMFNKNLRVDPASSAVTIRQVLGDRLYSEHFSF